MVEINLRENTDALLRRLGKRLPSSVDVYENEDELLVLVNLPGFDEDGIDLRFVNGSLKIHAEREGGRSGYEPVVEGRPVTADETVPLPTDTEPDTDGAETGYEDGVLSVRLPKKEEPEEGEEDETDEADGEEHPSSRDELEDMSYRELQEVAMDLDIKANQKTEVLVDEIADELDL
jgi:HSP20 family protein